MSRAAVLLAVDDDPDDRRCLERELTKRYGADYQVTCVGSADQAWELLTRLRDDRRVVSLVLADQWMPQMTGTELLVTAHRLHPMAKRALLITWGDRAAAEPILQATALGQIDAYVAKPVITPDEAFHRTITELLDQWARVHQPGFQAVRVVGEETAARSHEIRDMLSRNGVPFGFYPVDQQPGERMLERYAPGATSLPLVVLFDGRVLLDPPNAHIVEALGVDTTPGTDSYDVTVIGAGPAGLAAAVYGASEGLSTAVLEPQALGGQAGTSSRIRNYLGFPTGLAGDELAVRAYQQAWLFGAHFIYSKAVGVGAEGPVRVVSLAGGSRIRSRAVVIASGVSYRTLASPRLNELAGAGVFYGAASSEAKAMRGRDVYVVGAANSAGQAAAHLAAYAARVTILARGNSLTESMSEYLVTQIATTPNITVRYGVEVVDGGGRGQLESLTVRDRRSGAVETVAAGGLFVMIGAEPHTDWLPDDIARDRWGFVITGDDLLRDAEPARRWSLSRPPAMLESSLPGVFAVGDVRRGSVKRVASAVGEGSIAIHLIHRYLRDG